MLNNYLKIALRNLKRQKAYTLYHPDYNRVTGTTLMNPVKSLRLE